ncbi:MAG TPA: transcriptional repressor [Bacillota bacterium]|nr:transcriptional repressor [Bacillota bacterium]
MGLEVVLRDMGCKVTPQRLAIYEVLKNCNMHPTAETIYNIISSDYPTMSLATVYKTLDLLKETGIIQELNIAGNTSRYDVIPKPHPHILCTKCGKIENMDISLSKNLVNKAKRTSGYDIQNFQLYFFGVCPYCKNSE